MREMPYMPQFFVAILSESEVAQSCLTLCDPMDCSLPGSSVHGILQARVLEGVAISFSNLLCLGSGKLSPATSLNSKTTAGIYCNWLMTVC